MHEGGTASAVPPSLVLRPSGVEPLAGGGGEAVQLAGADADPDRVALAGDVARVDADDDLALTGIGADLLRGRAGIDQLAVGQGVCAELLDEDHPDRDGALVSLGDDVQRLRPEADGEVATVLGGDLGVHATVQRDVGVGQLRATLDHLERADVHRRGADEAGDEDVDRLVVQVARVADLLQHAILEHGDPVAHRHGLGLVVRHVDGGDAQAAGQRGDLAAGLDAQLRVQVGQRLVHQEHLGRTHDGAAHRDALPLATGEGLGATVEVLLEVEHLRGLFDTLADVRLRDAGDLQGEAHVVGDGHVRVQRVVLEHHRDVPVLGLDVGDVAVADQDAAGVDVLQACEHPQGGGLAAAGRPDEDEELAVLDVQVERLDRWALGPRVDPGGVVERDGCHAEFPPPARTCRWREFNMATVTFDKATRIYPGSERPAVESLDLHVEDGEFLVLVGPSGCGKSTSLRMLAGLEDVDSGRVLIGDRDVTDVQPKDRDIAMVFQNYALYPHMTVADNMGFALKIAGVPKADIRKRVEETAKMLDLTEYLDRRPKALSGGQRQRVAMGRAIVRQPQVFLMDEPLSNLDAKLRVQTRSQIASLTRRLGVTTVYVTHDQTEAMTMGDRIAVLKDGVLQQVGDPRDLYDQPVNVFVAGFIGSPAMNIGSFQVVEGGAQLANTRIPLDRGVLSKITAEDRGHLTVGFRPEALDVVTQAHEGAIPIRVVLIEELGADALAYCELVNAGSAAKGSAPMPVRARSSS